MSLVQADDGDSVRATRPFIMLLLLPANMEELRIKIRRRNVSQAWRESRSVQKFAVTEIIMTVCSAARVQRSASAVLSCVLWLIPGAFMASSYAFFSFLSSGVAGDQRTVPIRPLTRERYSLVLAWLERYLQAYGLVFTRALGTSTPLTAIYPGITQNSKNMCFSQS